MKFHNYLFALAGLFVIGCMSPRAAFTDMSPTPTATISGGWLTVHLGENTAKPLYSVGVKIKFEGGKAYVSGNHTAHVSSKEISSPLNVSEPAAAAVEVLWMNPDGTMVPIPQTASMQPAVASSPMAGN